MNYGELYASCLLTYHQSEHYGAEFLAPYLHYGETPNERERNFKKEIENCIKYHQNQEQRMEEAKKKQYDEEITILGKKAKEKVQNLIKSKDWKIVAHKFDEKITLKEITSEEGEYILRAEGIINVPLEIVVKMNLQHDIVPRKKWDKDLVDIRKIHSVKENLWILDSIVSIPVPFVADRRYVGLQWKGRLRRKRELLVTCSVSHPKNTRKLENVVESTGFSGLLVKPMENEQCHVVLVVQLKPGGWIPDAAVQFGKETAVQRLLLFEKAYKNGLIN